MRAIICVSGILVAVSCGCTKKSEQSSNKQTLHFSAEDPHITAEWLSGSWDTPAIPGNAISAAERAERGKKRCESIAGKKIAWVSKIAIVNELGQVQVQPWSGPQVNLGEWENDPSAKPDSILVIEPKDISKAKNIPDMGEDNFFPIDVPSNQLSKLRQGDDVIVSGTIVSYKPYEICSPAASFQGKPTRVRCGARLYLADAIVRVSDSLRPK